MLASQNRELVPQYQEFHVLGELGPPIPNEQPQNGDFWYSRARVY